MKPFAFPILTDENIGPGVVTGLQERGCDVRTVVDERLAGQGRPCAGRSTAPRRCDLAFGHTAIAAGAAFVGIVYLRPGHISSTFVLEIVDAVRRSSVEVEPPFVLVAERRSRRSAFGYELALPGEVNNQ